MENNEFLNGVSRDDLAFALGFSCHGYKNRTDQAEDMRAARERVRKALDSPARPIRFADLPAAQPQGEPVAWMCQRRPHESGRKFLPLISFDKWTNCPDDFDVWPLYRHPPEQPAPFAAPTPIGWRTENYKDDKSATTYDMEVAKRWSAKGWPVWPIFGDDVERSQ